MKKIILALCFLLVYQYSQAEIVRSVYKPDGSVVIIAPAPKSKLPNETDADWRERIFTGTMKDGGLEGLTYEDIDNSELPDRTYRNAWVGEKGKKVKIDMQKKKVIDDKKAKSIQDKQGAVSKLEALGLTEDDINALKK